MYTTALLLYVHSMKPCIPLCFLKCNVNFMVSTKYQQWNYFLHIPFYYLYYSKLLFTSKIPRWKWK